MDLEKIVKNINSGKMVVLLGAGPSAQAGYPGWKALADKTISALKAKGIPINEPLFQKCLDNYEYPQLFEYLH